MISPVRRVLAIALLALIFGGPPPARGATGAADLDDLLRDLQVVPLGGQTSPAFTLQTLEGKQVSLSDFRGRAVLLYFWATW